MALGILSLKENTFWRTQRILESNLLLWFCHTR